jgi:hypothetical protein
VRSKLDTTTSFIDLYTHTCGESEVPYSYNLWAGISILAAAVADRVWYEKFPGKKLPPNLYVGLIGPSANGKGEAIDTAVRLTQQHSAINVYNGRATPQFLFQWMARSRNAEDGQRYDNNKVLVVHEELSEAIDRGDSADRFVKFMTRHYTSRPYLTVDGTITRQLQGVTDPCLSWLFGSNLDWMLDVFPPSAISGGTWGRIVGVYQGYNLAYRKRKPSAPFDYDRVIDHLHMRLDELTAIEGPFWMTEHAEHIAEKWYTEREAPSDEALVPAWKRQDDLVLKLAMILSLSDSLDLKIGGHHMWRAQELSEVVMRKLGEIQAAAATTPDTRGISFAKQVLKGAKRPVLHTELLKKFYAKGLGGRDQLLNAVQTLMDSGEVLHRDSGRSRVYMWGGKRRMVRGKSEPEDESAE